MQGWREGPISFNPTYKYHLGCNVYSGEPVPPGIAAVRAVDSSASLADSVEAEGGSPASASTYVCHAYACDMSCLSYGSGTDGAYRGPCSNQREHLHLCKGVHCLTGPAESGVHGGRDSPAGVEKQKKRTPAWCDRVLWLPGRQLYQLAYGRGEIAVSDHRPVTAAFLFEAHRCVWLAVCNS